MSTINSPKAKLSQALKVKFPRIQKTDDICDVLIVGRGLGAISQASSQKRWKFVLKGATTAAFTRAYKYGLLVKQNSERRSFVMYMRGGRLKNERETRDALYRERKGLLAHLMASAVVRTAVAAVLLLPDNSLASIIRSLERGTILEQLNTYSKVVSHLTVKNLYNKNYDYFWMGFRYIADKYWLTPTALDLLSKAV